MVRKVIAGECAEWLRRLHQSIIIIAAFQIYSHWWWTNKCRENLKHLWSLFYIYF